MEKKIKNYKRDLIVICICYILTIIFNTHLFSSGDFIKIMYGLFMIAMGIIICYCLILINKDIKTSAKIATVLGPIISVSALIEGFMYGQKLIVNFRVTMLFLLIGGILIFNNGRKILKNNI